VQMASKIDQCSIRRIAESIGVHNANGDDLHTNPSCAIGGCANNLAPVTAAAAFAAIADQGVFCKPTIVDKIKDRDGNILKGQDAQCGQSIVSPGVANTAAYAMAGVFAGGTANASNPHDGTTYIGKTGTTDNAIHVWLVGSSTKVSTAVWVGNISGKQSLRKITVAGTQAALLRHRIFKPMALAVDSFYPGGSFPAPDPSLLKGSPVYVPDVTGMSPEQAKAAIELAELNWVDGGTGDSNLPAGQVYGSNPGAGTALPRGTEVATVTSNGLGVAVPGDLVGQSYAAAKAELMSGTYGFTNVVRDCGSPPTLPDPTPVTQVLSSDPGAGAVVNKNNVITLHTYGAPGPCAS
jgi:membrane peptidoglycan carboxypeptidase